MENYISANLTFLITKLRCSQDEFGAMFDLNRGNINQYVREKTQPKIETIQKICKHFEITIDDFINLDLSGQQYLKKPEQRVAAEPPSLYGNDKYLKQLEDMVQLQRDFIETQKEAIENLKSQLGHAS